MIFSDPLFIVSILLPFAGFAVVDRGLQLPLSIRFAFVMGLSLVYYWNGPAASPPLLAAYVVGNFLLLCVIGRGQFVLALAAIADVAALFYIKATHPGGAPLGISFHAFQLAGLMVALMQRPGMAVPAPSYFLFLTFFPQLVAGPIIHWNRVHRFFEHWYRRELSSVRLDWVFLFIAIGLSKKVFIADQLAPAVTAFQAAGARFDGADSLLFPFLYTVYLYMDFSAYSDIATGIAHMIGMRMPINFYSPYKATSPASFWRRWHRTLYKFLRNDVRYLYRWFGLPMGTAFLAFIFAFSGYWHGAALGYMLWGFGHFLYFRLYPRQWAERLPRSIQISSNFVVVALLWIPFALDAAGIGRWAEGLGRFCRSALAGSFPAVSASMSPTVIQLIVSGIVIVLVMPNGFQMVRSRQFWPLKRALVCILIILSLYQMFFAASGTAPFVYFQF